MKATRTPWLRLLASLASVMTAGILEQVRKANDRAGVEGGGAYRQ
jgi:hypothetical protein